MTAGRRQPGGYAKMDTSPKFFLLSVVFAAFARLAAASSFISDDVFVSHGSGLRSLLQAKTSCPVNFEFMNYTSITSRCKGPRYLVDQCCGAFKDFACLYTTEINDVTNDCASIMFSYINLNGNYPPGLFTNECRDGKEGLSCTASSLQSQNDSSSCPSQMSQSLVSVDFIMCASVLGFLFS